MACCHLCSCEIGHYHPNTFTICSPRIWYLPGGGWGQYTIPWFLSTKIPKADAVMHCDMNDWEGGVEKGLGIGNVDVSE